MLGGISTPCPKMWRLLFSSPPIVPGLMNPLCAPACLPCLPCRTLVCTCATSSARSSLEWTSSTSVGGAGQLLWINRQFLLPACPMQACSAAWWPANNSPAAAAAPHPANPAALCLLCCAWCRPQLHDPLHPHHHHRPHLLQGTGPGRGARRFRGVHRLHCGPGQHVSAPWEGECEEGGV